MTTGPNRRDAVEDDLRQPAFVGVNLDEYEVDEHGAVVRKDRWEVAVREAIIALRQHHPCGNELGTDSALCLAEAVRYALKAVDDAKRLASQAAAHVDGAPLGWCKASEIETSRAFGGSFNVWLKKYDCNTPVYSAPSTEKAPSFEDFKARWEGAVKGNGGFRYQDPVEVMFKYVKGLVEGE